MTTRSSVTRETVLRVEEMDCAAEEQQVRDALAQFGTSIERLGFDLARREVRIGHSVDDDKLVGALVDAGLHASFAHEASTRDSPAWRIGLLAGGGVAAIGAELAVWAGLEEDGLAVVAAACLAMALCGKAVAVKAFAALHRRRLTIDVLMVIAVGGAVAIGNWPEAATVIWLFAVAEWLEVRSVDRARNALRSLLELTPATVLVRTTEDGWEERPVESARVGDRFRVVAGARIALDGKVVSGRSTVNQAPITGESIPVEKSAGDAAFAGSINGSGVLDIDVSSIAAESTVARIVRAVEGAQAARAPTEQFVDRFARAYIPLVTSLAALVAIVPPLALGGAWAEWGYRALVLLVIACPCALVIATPVTLVSGLTAASRRGIVVKGGVHLENARRIRVVALDKTGTLTVGHPQLTDVVPISGSAADTLALAAGLARQSDHPVSAAISEAWDSSSAQGPLPVVTEVTAVPGRGLEGTVVGERVFLGNRAWMEVLGVRTPEVDAVLERLQSAGKSTVIVATGTRACGVLGVADPIRPTSAAAVAELRGLGVEVKMLSGDNPRTVRAIADAVGIADARGGLLPEQKLQAVQAFKVACGPVGMVGDGINDAPALAAASLGFAMGAAGSDTAIEAADVALMDDDPRKIAELFRLSRRLHRILIQNLVIAIGIKGVFVALAIAGKSTLWMAIFADLGASLIVVANGMRLARRATAP